MELGFLEHELGERSVIKMHSKLKEEPNVYIEKALQEVELFICLIGLCK